MRQAAYVAARIELAYEWIDRHGIIKPGTKGIPAGILQDLNRWENQAIRLYNALGLSPMSRMEFRAPGRDAMQAQSLEEGLKRGREAYDRAILEGRAKDPEADRKRLGIATWVRQAHNARAEVGLSLGGRRLVRVLEAIGATEHSFYVGEANSELERETDLPLVKRHAVIRKVVCRSPQGLLV